MRIKNTNRPTLVMVQGLSLRINSQPTTTANAMSMTVLSPGISDSKLMDKRALIPSVNGVIVARLVLTSAPPPKSVQKRKKASKSKRSR